MRTLAAATAFALTLFSPAAAEEPWAELTRRDLQAVHDILAVNHAGPVDPQNPRFRDWLEQGLAAGLAQAESVRDLPSYRDTLRRYTNGFRDGHIFFSLRADTLMRQWPGFTVRQDEAGRFRVTGSKFEDAPNGAEVLECDGTPLGARLDALASLHWNADIPHEKAFAAPKMFFLERNEPAPEACTLSVAGERRVVELSWSLLPRHEALAIEREALGRIVPEFGVRTVGSVEFVSMPSMQNVPESFFDALEAARGRLHAAPIVVLDVRGNGGGSSANGARALSILFGEPAVTRIAESFDWSVDWRVSEGNLADLRIQAASDIRSKEFIAGFERALARGDALFREAEPAKPLRGKGPKSPFTGQVYLLTDGACASACLDFADGARLLPGVVHVGLPTSGDAIYIDNRAEALPSGLAALSFGMKVYRNRVRSNNAYYTPKHVWPGGPMTDEALARWLEGLARPG